MRKTSVKRARLPCQSCHGSHGGAETLGPFEVNRLSGYSRDLSEAALPRVSRGVRPSMDMEDCIQCHVVQGRGGTSCLACHK